MRGIGKKSLAFLLAVCMFAGMPQFMYAETTADAGEAQEEAALAAAGIGERFEVDGVGYRRITDDTVQLVDWADASGTITIPERIEADGKELTVVSIGSKAFYRDYGESTLNVVHFPNTLVDIGDSAFRNAALTELELPEGLKVIGNCAFTAACLGNNGPTSLEIPDSVTTIGQGAFWDCSSFTHVKLPKNLTVLEAQVLRGCTRLSQIEFPQGLKTIRGNVFMQCSALKTLQLPASLVNIEGYAFRQSGLTQIEIPENVKTISSSLFYQCKSLQTVTLPSNLEKIENSAFEGCTALQGGVIPDGVTRIPQNCFWECSGNLTVTFPDTITYIHPTFSGVNDFQHAQCAIKIKCTSRSVAEYVYSVGHRNIELDGAVFSPDESALKFEDDNFIYRVTDSEKKYVRLDRKSSAEKPSGKVVIPQTVTHNDVEYTITGIGYLTFYRYSDMTEIVLPETVTNIGREAFYDCVGLTKVTLPEGLLGIDNLAFYGCGSLSGALELPRNCTNLGSGAFQKCGFTEVTLPDGITEIPASLFWDCDNLERIVIPNGVTAIGSNAFQSCEGLKEVIFPQSLTEIHTYAFQDCTALLRLNLPEGLTVIGESAFERCSGLSETLFLPDSVREVASAAFGGCTGLSRIHSGSGITILMEDAIPENAKLTAYDTDAKNVLVKSTSRTGANLPELLWDGKGDLPSGMSVRIEDDIAISDVVAIGAETDVTVAAGVSVVIAAGAGVTVGENATLTIENGGSVTAEGALTNNGSIAGTGGLDLKGTYAGAGVLGEGVAISVILADAMVADTADMVYRITPITPEPKVGVTIWGREIVFQKDVDFTYGYAENQMPGQASIVITPKEGGGLRGNAITKHFTIQKAPQTAPACELHFSLNEDGETVTATIEAVEGAEYSFDGTTWTDANTKTCAPNEACTAYIRMKESDTHTVSDYQTKSGVTPKLIQKAPECRLTFALNADKKTYTATIEAVEGAEYSFDGTTWTEENTKTDCLPETEYTAYLRLKEDDTHQMSEPKQVTLTTPELKSETPETPETPKIPEEKKLAAPSISALNGKAEKTGIFAEITVTPVENADRYEIYRIAGGQTTLIGTTLSGANVLLDENPVQEASYYAIAISKDGTLKSEAGQSVELTFAKAPKLKKAASVSGGIKITWKKAKAAKKYVIYRSTKKNSGYTKVRMLGKKKTSFIDKKAKKGKNYYYKIAMLTKSQPSLMSKASKKVKR